MWSEAEIEGQPQSRNSWSHQELEEAGKNPPLAPHLDLGLLAPRTVRETPGDEE